MSRTASAFVTSFVMVALAALLAGEGAAATSCTVQDRNFRVDLVSISDVPCAVGTCSRFLYSIVPLTGIGAAHAALVFPTVFGSTGGDIRIVEVLACDGAGTCMSSPSVTEIVPGDNDGPTGLGGELTLQGARINASSVLDFAVDILGGGLAATAGTVAVQASGKGDKISACVIDAPAAFDGNPRLATTPETCFEKNGCTACFVQSGDELVYDPDSSNIGGPGCPQGKVMSGAGLAVTLPDEAQDALVQAIPFPVGSIGGTASTGSCPFIYTKSDGSIGGFCDCFGVFEGGFFVQKDPLSLCGPPTGCCTAGPFGGMNHSCGLSPVRDISSGMEGPLCPSN